MPFKFDGFDYHLLLSKEQFKSLEKTGMLEEGITNFAGDKDLGAKVVISVSENKNPEGVELTPSYHDGNRSKLEGVKVKVSKSALRTINRGFVYTTYGVTSNKVRIGIYPLK